MIWFWLGNAAPPPGGAAFIKTAKTKKMAGAKTKKIEFIKSPTGAFKLAYNRGDVATLPAELAGELVKLKYAKAVIAKKA